VILNRGDIMQSWGPHGRRILHLLSTAGPASREQLHQMTGLHRALVSDTVRRLIDDGLVRLGDPQIRGSGRPQTPIMLDDTRRSILGVAIEPGAVSACRVNLIGEALEEPVVRPRTRRDDPIDFAKSLIGQWFNPDLMAIGVSVTGVFDPDRGVMLESSALRNTPVDPQPLRDAAGAAPLILENDLHALAQHWSIHHDAHMHEDVLLVRLEDGAMGAAHLIGGRAHVGCVSAASELGHTRLAVKTRRCFCGHRGCLERIFDSRFAADQDGRSLTLEKRLATAGRLDSTMARIVDLVGLGIANAVQITKPHRVVLVSSHSARAAFRRRIATVIRREMLRSLRDHVRLQWWDGPSCAAAVVAAYPALALVFQDPAVSNDSRSRRVG
jgi:predicted NBD/HSP70 family sugar kinase